MRSPKQIRLETCFHESGHAVAAHLLGRRIRSASVWSEEALSVPEVVVDADAIGRVVLENRPPRSLEEAIADIVGCFAGEAASHIAWALGIVTDEQVGAKEIPIEELSADELLIVGSGQSPAQAAAARAYYRMPADGDQADAREIAKVWTSDPLEAAALIGFCQRRTANFAATDRFQAATNMLAGFLEEQGEMTGELIHHLLEREDEIHEQGAVAPEGGAA